MSTIYLARMPSIIDVRLLVVLGSLALIGSNLVSYSTARAKSLGMDPGKPTLACKGMRTAVMVLCAWGSVVWSGLPVVVLGYLALHPNLVVISRMLRIRDTS